MTTLITGGAGFIGSHLVDHLVDCGERVIVLDDLSTGRLSNLDRHGDDSVHLVRGSIVDTELVDRLVAEVDRVFHLAAAVGVFRIQNDTLDSMRVNVRGTEVIVEAATRHSAALLLASTSEVYGKNTAPGLREDDDRIIGSPQLSRWSYAEAKALDEALVHQHVMHHGLRAVTVRLFNTVGPRQTGRYGMVMPRFVRQAIREEPVTVYGSGDQVRCFCHVEDVVPALVALMDSPDAVGSVFNLGSTEQVSIQELAERVIGRTGSHSSVVHLPYYEVYGDGFEDMERRIPNCERARKLVGFEPARRLDDIIDAVAADLSA
ncbi:NAD-dependent epimerase/dehydratase family protein [Nocardioides pakistanensis]